MRSLIRLALVAITFVCVYFFSYQIQRVVAGMLHKVSTKLGVYSADKEFALQRYIYLHRSSLIASLYRFVNEQIISLGLKRYGITPVGYFFFWCIVAVPLTIMVWYLMALSVGVVPFLYMIVVALMLLLTRVYVADKMQRRELDIMNAEDLIIPLIMNNGIHQAITKYRNKIPSSIRPDFDKFLSEISGRGYSFDEAMIRLADNLGSVFNDFAQKAIYYENLGEKDLVDLFTDIVETNRLRRQLREENDRDFADLKKNFTVSAIMTTGYAIFAITTDENSRYIFLETTVGKILLIIMVLIVISVLGYITTIKSKAI